MRAVLLIAMCCALLVCSSANPATAQDAQAKQLRWKFAKGDKFEVDFVQQLTQTTDVNGKKFSYIMNFDLGMDWEVTDVADQQATIHQGFRHLKVEWTSAKDQEPVTFDSREEGKPKGAIKQVANTLLPLLDCKFDVVMNTRGELISVEVDKESKKILRSLPDSMEIRKLFTKDGISKTLSQAAIVFPEKEIAVGESWDTSDVIASPAGQVTLARKYEYSGPEEVDGATLEKITVSGQVQFEQALESKARKPQTVTDSSQTGELLFDVDAGILVSSQLTQAIDTETPYRDTQLKAGTKSTLNVKFKRVK